MTTIKIKLIPCPNCKTECEYSPRNEFRPFCSARCKNSDIIAWADQKYSVEGRPASPEEFAEELQKSFNLKINLP